MVDNLGQGLGLLAERTKQELRFPGKKLSGRKIVKAKQHCPQRLQNDFLAMARNTLEHCKERCEDRG
jgi:hypothetical protein